MNQIFFLWIEEYLFYPRLFQKILSFILSPFSILYLLIILLKRLFSIKKDFKVPIISVGNLIIGGSGKTPMIISLVKDKKDVAVILRGYGRVSKGLYTISKDGNILHDVSISGDEAMLLAKSLPNATIIVCENRVKGIKEAIRLKKKIIFLDDAFSKYSIKKLDVLLIPKIEPKNSMLIPSGCYREPKFMYNFTDILLKDGVDFKRVVKYKLGSKFINILPTKLLLLTSISKANRLLEYLPKYTKIVIFKDHYNFNHQDIDNILLKYKNYSIITTSKDMVKLEQFNISNLYLMHLQLEMISSSKLTKIDDYINSFY